MIPAAQTKILFFKLGVLAAALHPRLPGDSRWSIGGKLSRPFRQVLLVLVALGFVRVFTSQRETKSLLFSDALGVVEVVGITFLCFLTPFILQCWLADVINIGGRPGANLKPWLYVAAILSVLGVVLSRTVHPNLWLFKKIANVVSAPLVLNTLGMYNSITTPDHGRGTVMSQTLMIVEYWHVATQLLCAVGYALNNHEPEEKDEQWEAFLRASREIAFVSDWTRVLCHALMLNMLDEMCHVRHVRSDPVPPENGSPESGNALVATNRKQHTQAT